MPCVAPRYVSAMIDPPLGISGAAARDRAISEYADTSSACLNTSRGVDVKFPSSFLRKLRSANASECTRKSIVPNLSRAAEKNVSIDSSELTSHGCSHASAKPLSSIAFFTRRWLFSMLSIGRQPKPHVAPCRIALLAVCVAIERSLAMLRISPFFPSSRPGMAFLSVKVREKRQGASLCAGGGDAKRDGVEELPHRPRESSQIISATLERRPVRHATRGRPRSRIRWASRR